MYSTLEMIVTYVTGSAKTRHVRTILKILFIASMLFGLIKEWTAKVSADCVEWSWSYSARQLEQQNI